MDYPILNKLFYKDNKKYLVERENRKNSVSSVVLPFKIHSNEAFYINCPQLTTKLVAIFDKFIILNESIEALPKIAYSSYKRNCLVDEVMMTNDIEGVYSTRKEINAILNKTSKQEAKVRLFGLVKKYAMLSSDEGIDIELKSCKDIRALYDEIVISEIDPSDLPDGLYFRKNSVSVFSATEKEKHRGVVPPEENIIDAMDQALSILDNEDIPMLVRIALFHYYFGYIHPFYDGNGRLSRFISSYLIKNNLNTLIALRLSYAIKNNKKAYYDAFDTVNDEKSYGDTTPFILTFLNMLIDSEEGLISKLDQGRERLAYYTECLDKIEDNIDKELIGILFVLIQNNLFGDERFDISDLSEIREVSPGTMRKRMGELLETKLKDCLIITRQGHKNCYDIDLSKLESCCNDSYQKEG